MNRGPQMHVKRKGRRVALVAGLAMLVLAIVAVTGYRGEFHEWFVLTTRFESLGVNAQGFPEYRHRASGVVMVRIPGGEFLMGSGPRADGVATLEGPQHRVTLSPFLIGKREVTQGEWTRILGKNPSTHTGEDLPVHNVSWDECREYGTRVGLKLPTEAQWEFACRAGDRIPGYAATPGFDGHIAQLKDRNGNRLDGMTEEKLDAFARVLDEIAWFGENSGDKPHPVGQKKPNGYGLYDMIGNAFELCEDRYDRDFYRTAEASALDPVCRSDANSRIGRGGCYWLHGEIYNDRPTYRFGFPKDARQDFLGLRVALPLR
jgi:formylglycine-generating enzyme required for sulfatase activity